MEEDIQVPILLGRPFLTTIGAIIDVKHGKLALNVGKEKVEFEFANLMKGPSINDFCCVIDVIARCVKECLLASPTHDGFEMFLVKNAGTKLDGDAQAYEKLLDENPPIKGLGIKEVVEYKVVPLPKEAPKLDLKPLPPNLRYEFLGPNSTYPEKLLKILKALEFLRYEIC